MPDEAAHSSSWQTFEAVFGIPLLIAIGLQLAFPLSLPGGVLRQVGIPLGAALILAGLAFVILARRAFARHNQPTDPGHPTTRIITTGVFSVSRNPLYLGGASVLAGAALAANWLWVLALLLPSLIVCHYILIAPEEQYLLAKFGTEYRAYERSVYRWFGRKRTAQPR